MRKYTPFLLIIVMFVMILGFSAQSGQSSNDITSRIARTIESFLIDHKSYDYRAEQINLIIRKLAHFSEYLIFTVLVFIGFHNVFKRVFGALFLTGFVGVVLALFDETFQSNSIGRSSSLFDVLIDCSGVGVGLIAALCFIILSKKTA